MGTSVVTTPPTLALVKNDVRCRIETDNYETTAPILANSEFQISGDPVDGETIQFEWGDHDFTFTFKASPTECDHLPLRAGATYEDWAILLDAVFASNYYLYNDFISDYSLGDPTAGPINFSFEARDSGSNNDLTITTAATGVGAATNNAGTTPTYRENFKIWLDIWAETSHLGGVFEKLAELEGDPDTDFQAVFNLRRALLSSLSIDVPEYNATAEFYANNIIRRYFVKHSEAYGFPKVAQCYERDPVGGYYLALLAGVSEQDFPGNSFYLDHFTAQEPKFLTAAPRTQKVRTDQQKYFYHYVQTDNEINFQIEINYSDGTSSTHIVHTIQNQAGRIVVLPAGYTQLDIESLKTAGKTVKSYRFFGDYEVADINTESILLEVDQSQRQYVWHFHFHNSCGGFDSEYFYGNKVKTVLVEATQFQTQLPESYFSSFDSNIQEGEDHAEQHELTQTFEVFTGYHSRAYIDYLQEFMLSGKIFQDKDGKFIEIKIIDGSEKELYDEIQSLYALSFQMKYAFTNRAYSASL